MTFEELYETYADRVYAYLNFKIKDVHLVQDIVQDTFLTAFHQLAKGRPPDRPKAWLLTIAHRRMVDLLRRRPSNETVLEAGGALPESLQRDCADNVYIRDLLGRLDEVSRDMLYALYVEGLTIRETAQLLGIPEGTVKSRSYKARTRLAVWIKEDDLDGA